MKLEEYNEFKEKKVLFQHDTIETVEKFDAWINTFEFEGSEILVPNKLIYRGSNEAKYKNYTSAQRDWITREWSKVLTVSFVDYIDQLLTKIRKNILLTTYFKSLNIIPNDILYLSFMQHYAMPSPLLDFTKDIRTALFFAIDGMKYTPSSKEIENYFSVYALMPTNEYAPADVLFSNGIRDAKSMLEDFKMNNPTTNINDELLRNIDLLTKWKKTDGTQDGLHVIPFMYIPNPLDAISVITPDNQRLYWSNPNIVAQKGCFIMNTSEKDVLEEVVAKNQFMKKMMCIDIHKSLAEYVKERYLSDLNTKNMYPKFKQIADKAYEEFKAEIS